MKSNKEDDFLLVDESNEESLSIDSPARQREDGPTDFSDTTEDGEDNGKEQVKGVCVYVK